MSDQPDTNAEDDIKIVLQNSLMQTAKALLAFTRAEGFALQIPETATHIFAGPLPRIAQFVESSSVDWRPYQSALSRCAELLDNMSEGDALVDTPKFLAAKLASQSQAAQPSIEALVDSFLTHGVLGDMPNHRAKLIQLAKDAAHLAGTSQATKAQAEPTGNDIARAIFKHLRPAPFVDADWDSNTVLGAGNAVRHKFLAAAKAAQDLFAAPVAKEAPAVPEGWKLVPMEPTPEMVRACDLKFVPRVALPIYVAAYRTMIAAAPTAQEVTQQAVPTDEVKQLRNRVSQLEAARIGYASEFALNADGEPDIGNIHANIRALKAKFAATTQQAAKAETGSVQVSGISYPTTYDDLARVTPAALWNRWLGDRSPSSILPRDAFIAARSIIAPTTSTVSAPLGYVSEDAMATLNAGSGVLTAIVPRAINGADLPIYAGTVSAPEEVRNQALFEVALPPGLPFVVGNQAKYHGMHFTEIMPTGKIGKISAHITGPVARANSNYAEFIVAACNYYSHALRTTSGKGEAE